MNWNNFSSFEEFLEKEHCYNKYYYINICRGHSNWNNDWDYDNNLSPESKMQIKRIFDLTISFLKKIEIFDILDLQESLEVLNNSYWNLNLNISDYVSDDSIIEHKKNEKRKNKNMENNKMNRTINTTKSDIKNACWQLAADKAEEFTAKALLKILKDNGVNSIILQTIKNMLETKAGRAAWAYVLGLAFTFNPLDMEFSPQLERLAQELRIKGWKDSLGLIADKFMNPMSNALEKALREAKVK